MANKNNKKAANKADLDQELEGSTLVADIEGSAVAGASLVADLDAHGEKAAQEVSFWLGVTPDFPTPYITCAGFCFPKLVELLIDDPSRNGEKQRVPVIGGLHQRVTDHMLSKLKEKLPRLVIRFLEPPSKQDPSANVQGVTDVAKQPRKGFIITIPTKGDMEAAAKSGQPVIPYVRKEWDEPAANYMFMQPCIDQKRPGRGGSYPKTLNLTGLDIKSVEDMQELLT